ncbi:MAG: hypothetical protein OEW39_06450, partial [Deltaproteobacteria bacterium]|nr:hypothetical protein [Deltaproteobacteria bacterium]
GETVDLKLSRGGNLHTVTLKLKGLPNGARIRRQFDVEPSYFITAGLVFMNLDQEFLNTFGNFWKEAEKHLLYAHFQNFIEHPREARQRVVLSRLLPHRVNSAYGGMVNRLLKAVNGVEIRTLSDIPKALENPENGVHRFELEPGALLMVLDAKEAGVAHQEILTSYGIRSDRRLP